MFSISNDNFMIEILYMVVVDDDFGVVCFEGFVNSLDYELIIVLDRRLEYVENVLIDVG